MRDDVKLIMSKRNEEINSKFYQLFCRVTVVFLLASISIGCYFAAKDLKPYGNYNNFAAATVEETLTNGKYMQ